jgi:hypothetical protein
MPRSSAAPPRPYPKDLTMLQSHIIDIDGVFVGAAVRIDRGYRFIATDYRLEELDCSVWPTLDDVRRVARRVYLTETSGDHVAPRPAAAPRHRGDPRLVELRRQIVGLLGIDASW